MALNSKIYWKIHGDSLQQFNIHNGDMVTIQPAIGDLDGKIILCEADGQVLFRKVDFKPRSSLRLISGNKNLPVIEPKQFRVIGML